MPLHLLDLGSKEALGWKRGKEGMGCLPIWEVSIRPSKVTLTRHPNISFIPDNTCITAN